jgi:hypothetical protein
MKTKSLLFVVLASLGLTTPTMAQNLPSYVPADGIVGWWPFNGNANDESGNGNNGTVNGATLSDDRNGIANSSYYFNGQTDFISVPDANIMLPSNISLSSWVKIPSNYMGNNGVGRIVRSRFYGYTLSFILSSNSINFEIWTNASNSTLLTTQNVITNDDVWHNIVGTFNGNEIKLYFDGLLIGSLPTPNSNILYSSDGLVMFGRDGNNPSPLTALYQGWIDDIGIWNRALTQEEITALFNATNCSNNLTISPQVNQLQAGGSANFIATTSDTFPSFIWQSDFGQGFQTLNNYGNYSGVNTNSLSISNVQLPNHTQPIRVISTSGECTDTSDVATISILDTCVISINDTTFVTVTDTLVINTLITGINPPNNSNTIKVYPNPANSHITIEYGDFAIMNEYQLRIENSIGQEVFQTSITQQSDYLNLNSWGGNGLYFVHIVDPQGNTIDIRKIVLQ